MTNMRPPSETRGPNSLIFNLNKNGRFSVKRPKAMAGVEGRKSGQMTEAELDTKKMWCHIWYKGTVPPQLCLFMWKLAHGALPLCKLM